MHFRHQQDEITFGKLKAFLVQSMQGAPAHTLNDVLRVLGRIESMAFYEGVRQGSISRAIEDRVHPELDRHPIAQHARLYNAAFTPLAEAERAYIERFVVDKDDVDAFLPECMHAEPMLIPPMTLSEALARPEQAFGLVAPSQPDTTPALPTTVMPTSIAPARAQTELDVLTSLLNDENQMLADLIRNADSNGIIELSVAQSDGSARALEQPSFIERCRDVLQARMSGGWNAASWKDVVFAVRDDLKADPYMIDLSLSTDVGKNMLRSIGLFEIADSILDASQIQAMLHSST